MEAKQIFDSIIEELKEKKARKITAIDIENITTIASYFVICSGTSTTHIKSLSDAVEKKLKENDLEFLRKEGYRSARWILMDYADVVVHIFHEEDREFYNLEHLWQDGEVTEIPDEF